MSIYRTAKMESNFISAATTREKLGNSRSEEIILDHDLTKSSNVTTPESFAVDEGEAKPLGASRQKTVSDSSSMVPMDRQDTTVISDDSREKMQYSPVILPSPQTYKPESTSIDDDFFSFKVQHIVVEKRKKKKKVKVKKPKGDSFEQTIDAESLVVHDSPEKSVQLEETNIETVIVLDDDNECDSMAQPSLKRNLDFPVFDEAALRRQAKHRLEAEMRAQSADLEIFEASDEDFTAKLKKIASKTEKILSNRERDPSFRERSTSREPSFERAYKLTVTSHIPGSQDYALTISMKGNKTFSSVISKTLKYLLGLEVVEESLRFLYDPVNVTLMRDTMELLEFMKPESLDVRRGPDGSFELALGLYTKTQARGVVEFMEREKRDKLKQLERDEELDRITKSLLPTDDFDPHARDKEFEEIDREIAIEDQRHRTEDNLVEEEKDYFKIVLMGANKSRVDVKVRPVTKISKLAQYFIEKSGLPAETRLRLVFDDEDLDFCSTVGDTELEEDFTVDVYVLK